MCVETLSDIGPPKETSPIKLIDLLQLVDRWMVDSTHIMDK